MKIQSLIIAGIIDKKYVTKVTNHLHYTGGIIDILGYNDGS